MTVHYPEFTQLSESIDESGRRHLRAQFAVTPDCLYLQGHFPEAPLLPGVTQLDWAIQLAADHWQTPRTVRTIEVLKFNDMILPKAEVTLTLEWKRDDCVVFRYQHNDKAYSSGRLIFNSAA
ncbi:hydroxymyristoyl-ACP dehydratase [Pseudidiomarina aquimaris]|uniref:Hydroxymyristoyl-ACP dehydratase n=1 Tax=Pseudidiomarina aquimaris TaxID=641841 RepID=A0A432XH77_9GAMM|nr:hydroxymyristoyl-ACP dehydratase [Pseudidiomarina aquimaris]RUO48103.1 hydroxymyristoyl-ACP dehydratase [Pseudidiomarina aquimaris]